MRKCCARPLVSTVLALLFAALGAGSVSAQVNGVFREVYLNIGGGVTVADLTNAAIFPNNPSSTNILGDAFEAPTDIAENYGQRCRALILPPTTGSYTFWIASDDASDLYLSTDENPANRVRVAYVAAWTASRAWTTEPNQTSAPITLTNGQRYYLEALMKEGGGGDNLAVRWQLPGGTIEEPIPASRLLAYGGAPTSPPIITQQPTNVTVVEGGAAAFTVRLSNADLLTFQWKRNGTNIPGAPNANTYSLPLVTLADNASTFSCFITNALGTTNTASALLTVLADTNAPALVNVANTSATSVIVIFSEPVEPATATNKLNYTLTGGVAVNNAAFGTNTSTIILTTTTLAIPGSYTLTVNNVRDRAATPNTIAAGSTANFTALTKGIFREFYANIGGATVADLTNHPSFPNSPTSTSTLTSSLETPANTADNYGQRLRSFIIAPTNGNYTFWVAADESALLYLSTSENPAAKVPIASVLAATGARDYTKETNQQSGAITLVAGQKYYIEALMKEGTGNDHLSVRWRLPNGVVEEPIPAWRLTPETTPVISSQPTNTTVVEGSPAILRVAVSNFTPPSFRWQRNGVNISGATTAIYTNAAAPLTDNAIGFRCVITNALGAVTSSVATLTVTPDVFPPALFRVFNAGATTVRVVFSEPVEIATATNRLNYAIDGGVSISAAAFGSDTRTINLTVSTLTYGNSYTLTVNNVRDRATTPNAIAAGSQALFVATEFLGVDIGTPLPAGFSLGMTNSGLMVTGGGADIGGTSDQFQFGYSQRTGNFDIKVRVQSLHFTDPFAEAGLMARESLNANGRFAAALATPSFNGCYFQSRDPADGSASSGGSFPVNFPSTWLRLQRSGNVFTGFASYDGQTWTQLGTATIAMPSTVFFGLAVSSRNASQTTTAQFRDLMNVSGAVLGAQTLPIEPPGPSSRKSPLVITEIHYHPPDRADLRDLEFVEIFNSQAWTEDIGGFRLSGEVEYTFAPGTVLRSGEYLVVAKAPDDIRAVYGIPNVAGPFTGSLNNGGGTVRLRSKFGAVLQEVNYNNQPPWPVAAAGAGHSLALTRPTYGEGSVLGWSASGDMGGSPGAMDGVSPEPARAVVINEFLAHTDDPEQDFIELYNRSTATVNLSGLWLSDEAGTNKFRIPNATTLSPRGFVSFNQTTLGFSLASGGETIFLVNSNQNRVLDVVQFAGQENGVSSGRFPDGAPTFHALVSKTPGTNNTRLLIRDLVINEIMYNPVSGLSDDEYVELYNKGSNAVNVGKWKFTDGINYTIPNNTVIASNAFLVIAKNASRLLTNYAGLTAANCLGNFGGSLSGRGERVELSMPDQVTGTNDLGQPVTNTIYIVVDEVTYGTGGRWGSLADGGGSSLELMDPRSDNRLAPNWADSDETAKSAWITNQFTGVLDNGNGAADRLQILLLGAGECLIDDVEVIGPGNTNRVANSNFTSNASGWFAQGTHGTSSWESTGGFGGGGCYRIRASGRGDTGANRTYTALTTALNAGETATLRARVRYLKGTPDILLRLHGSWLESPGNIVNARNFGTPGARNSRAATNAGPAITDVTHAPILPAASQPIVVSARVHDPDGLASVQLKYRADPSATLTTLTMLDNGTGGDALAGDGIYSATLPGQAGGTLIAFHVQATDSFAPAATTKFPSDAPTRECLVGWGESVPAGSFGTYRFWITQNTINTWANRERNSNDPLDCTFVYGNHRVVYNTRTLYSGSPFHTGGYCGPTCGTCDYVLNLPEDDLMLGVTDFVLNTVGNLGSDDNAQREQAAFWIAGQLGAPFNYRRYVRVFVNGQSRANVFEDAQQPNSDMIDQWFPDGNDGSLHKIEDWFEFDDAGSGFSNVDANLGVYTTTGGQKKTARYRWSWRPRAVETSANDFTNLFALVDAVNAAGPEPYTTLVENLVDVDEWMRIFAMERIAGNWDSYGYGRGKNMYAYKPENGKWALMAWDIDFVLGSGSNPFDAGLGAGGDGAIVRMESTPVFARALWRAYEDAVNGPMNPVNADALYDAKYAALTANGVGVQPPAAMKDFISQRRGYIQSQLATVAASFAVSGPASFSTNRNLITISGTAPVGVKTIEINGIAYRVTWTGVTTWTLRYPLGAGANTLAVQGIDLRGNAVASAAATLNINYTGAVEQPQDKLVINEIMYNPVVPDASFVEVHNTSVSNAFDLSLWRLDGIDFTFPEGSVLEAGAFMVIVKDATVFATTYGSSIPIVGEFDGQLDNGGETLALIKPGATLAQDSVIDRVTYDEDMPWPAAADGGGASLQLIDPAQDNNRVMNWAAVPTNAPPPAPQWVYVTQTGTASSSSLYVYLQTAGDVYLDDITIVAGSVAEAGVNVVSNGGFEATFPGTSWTIGTDGNNSASVISTSVKRSGNASLHLIASAGGTTRNNSIWQNFSPALPANATYTLSYWYLQSTNGGPLTLRLSGNGINSTVSPAPPNVGVAARFTPGAVNSARATLPAIPKLWLNEVLPNNVNGNTDRFGHRHPWAELYNGGTSNLNLSGHFLANNYSNLTQWAFPANTIVTNGQFLVVWLDGNTGESVSNELHASFTIPADIGAVALVRTNGGQTNILDYLNYSVPNAGRSYGDFPDGSVSDRRSFYYITPGGTNNPASAPLTVFINEWMAGNTSTLADPAGGTPNAFQDWFEIYNPGASAVNLGDYYFADSITNKQQFHIPNNGRYVIPPLGYLLVWADAESGQNGTNSADLHVNFKLDRDPGDSIGLFAADGTTIDFVTFGVQTNDVSQGRFQDGQAAVYFMTTPTPRAANTIALSNTPPMLSAIANRVVNENTLLTFTAGASDPDVPVQKLTWSLDGTPPAGAGINATNGVFSWQPNEAQGPGVYNFTARVTDAGVPAKDDAKSFTVTVDEVNDPPVLATITNRTVFEGRITTFTATATDPDGGQALVFSLVAPVPLGAGMFSSGVFFWTPSEAQGPGTYFITVKVEDSGSPSQSDTKTFSVFVLESNTPPVWVGITGNRIHSEGLFRFTALATDTDLPMQALTWSLDGSPPAGAGIDTNTGVFSWLVSAAQADSTNVLVFRATDNGMPPLSVVQPYTVIVVGPLRIIHIDKSAGGVVTIGWDAIPGRGYQLQFKNTFDDANWMDLGGVVTAIAATASTTDTVGADTQRIYRVVQVTEP